jgi:hypothetical protein
MSSKVSLGNVFLFHMYLMVARMKINFSKVLASLNSSNKSSVKGMGNLSLMVSLLRAQKSGHMRQVPSFLSIMTTREE